MLKAIQVKILIAILAVLAVIGGLLVHQSHVNAQAAADAAKARAILEQQQRDADARKKHDEELWRQVQKKRQMSNATAAKESKTWQKYIP